MGLLGDNWDHSRFKFRTPSPTDLSIYRIVGWAWLLTRVQSTYVSYKLTPACTPHSSTDPIYRSTWTMALLDLRRQVICTNCTELRRAGGNYCSQSRRWGLKPASYDIYLLKINSKWKKMCKSSVNSNISFNNPVQFIT